MTALSFLADECLNDNIVRGLLRATSLDLIRVRDTELLGASDSEVLTWAAENHRVVLSHDSNTLTKHAYDRIRAALPMPGLIIVPAKLSIGDAIEQILFLHEHARAEDFDQQVRYLPLR